MKAEGLSRENIVCILASNIKSEKISPIEARRLNSEVGWPINAWKDGGYTFIPAYQAPDEWLEEAIKLAQKIE